MVDEPKALFDIPEQTAKEKRHIKWQNIKYWCSNFKYTDTFAVIVITGALLLVAMFFVVLANVIENKSNMEKCKVMEENGNNVKIEVHKVLIGWKKCYVEIEEGRYIPYDTSYNDMWINAAIGELKKFEKEIKEKKKELEELKGKKK